MFFLQHHYFHHTSFATADRYYKPNEWAKLTGEERQRVRDARERRDKRRGVGAVSSHNKKRNKPNDETSVTGSAFCLKRPFFGPNIFGET